jgi:hypothetical protein
MQRNDNQHIIQSTRMIFTLFQPLTLDVVISAGKVLSPNAGRRSGAPNTYWPQSDG